MRQALTLDRWTAPRLLSLLAGSGMIASAAVTLQQFFATRYPTTRTGSALCELAPPLGCESTALAPLAQLWGVPLGWFGLLLGALVVLGALLPSISLERTNRALALLNAAAALALTSYAALALRSLCLPCVAYSGFSLASAALFVRYRDGEAGSPFLPALPQLAAIALIALAGAWSTAQYHAAVKGMEEGTVGIRAVSHFYSLPQVPWPSEISPYWTARATAEFEDAPIRIVEYADLLCIDCQVSYAQLRQLEREFPGKVNIAFQFFPLEAKCNDVVEKDKHPGACDLAYLAAADLRSFRAIHDEIYDHMQVAKADPQWRLDLARRYGVEGALADTALQARVHRLIRTGAEYEKTSEKYEHGIRSTPTLIINNRMIIGTLPLEHMRAIFRALIDEHEGSGAAFIENWLDPGCALDPEGGPPKPCS